jgi:teichuronic acid biosynthesis glycosyltransferase TuaH
MFASSEIGLQVSTIHRKLIVICSGTAWDGMALPERMLAGELLRHARVLFVDPHYSVISRGAAGSRSVRPRLDYPAEGLIRLRPVALPFHTRRGIRIVTPRLVRAQIRWALRRIGQRPYAVIDGRIGRLLGGWGPGVRNVLYGTDDYVSGAQLMGLDVAALRRDERATLRQADLVFAISPTLADRWREMGATVELLPNGVQADAYDDVDRAEPAPEVRLPHPVAGVLGHLSDRIDMTLLEAVVAGDISLLLVGPHDPRWEPTRFQRLLTHPRVAWVGKRPFAELPRYLRHIDVGITPYFDSEFNRASFPLKTLEYLAAGRPVVSTDLPATRWLDTDLVRLATGPDQFVAAVREAVAETHDQERVGARRALARQHSWRVRADRAAAAIGLG